MYSVYYDAFIMDDDFDDKTNCRKFDDLNDAMRLYRNYSNWCTMYIINDETNEKFDKKKLNYLLLMGYGVDYD